MNTTPTTVDRPTRSPATLPTVPDDEEPRSDAGRPDAPGDTGSSDKPRRGPGRPHKNPDDPRPTPPAPRKIRPVPIPPDTDPGDTTTSPGDADTAPEIMDLKEVSKFLRFSLGHTRQLAEEGWIPGMKLGTQWRFSRRALLAQMGWVDPQ